MKKPSAVPTVTRSLPRVLLRDDAVAAPTMGRARIEPLGPAVSPGSQIPYHPFEQVVEEQRDAMFRAARRLLPSDDLAWDAVQVVLTRLWQRGYLPSDPGPVLRELARRTALQLLRSERRRAAAELGSCPVCGGELDGHEPLDELHAAELQGVLEAALVHLPAEQRRAFELVALQESGYALAARTEGVPPGTIRSRVHRARKALAERLLGPGAYAGEGDVR